MTKPLTRTMMMPARRTKRTDAVLRTLARPARRDQTASDHARGALQTLSNLNEFGGLEPVDRREVRAAMQRLWLVLRELEQGNS